MTRNPAKLPRPNRLLLHLCAVYAVASATPHLAHAQCSHNAPIVSMTCESPKPTCGSDYDCPDSACIEGYCASPLGAFTDCTLKVVHGDPCGDVTKITQGFDVQDFGGDNVRVPPAGDLPISEVTGNAVCCPGPVLPCFVGPAGSAGTFMSFACGNLSLLGSATAGSVSFRSNTYNVQPSDPSSLPTQGNVKWQDQCDKGLPSCSTGIVTTQQMALTNLVGGCAVRPLSPDTPCPDDGNQCATAACDGLGSCDQSRLPRDCADGDACTVHSCDPGSGCQQIPFPYPGCNLCGNGRIDPGETCDLGAGSVDSPTACCNRFCQFASSSTVCRAAIGPCDAPERCTGNDETCPSDAVSSKEKVCRIAAGVCDAPENCSGESADCPPDARRPPGHPCPDEDGRNVCTDDQCDGQSVACTHPAKAGSIECRSAHSVCDAPELCQGPVCPPDLPASAGTPCTTDGVECSDDVCNATGTCTHPTKPRLTPCGESAVCDGLVCRHLPANCTIVNPPVRDPGEQCDDGANNETPVSCCRFDCTFQPVGTACTAVDSGVCNTAGQCVVPGQCGNGVPGEVFVVDGVARLEQCDLGSGNTDAQNQASCCSPQCRVFDGTFTCQVPPTTCQRIATCGDASNPAGTCPAPLAGPNDVPCFATCQLGQCSNGECTGRTVCDVNVVRKGSKLPSFKLQCNSAEDAQGSPSCDVRIGVPLRSLLSAAGLDLVLPSRTMAAVAQRHPAALGGDCPDAADLVRRSCDATDPDKPAFVCAQQSLRATRKPKGCPGTPCYQALVALGKKCKAALGKRSETLEVSLVADITGIAFAGNDDTQRLRVKRSCKSQGHCR